MLWFFWTLRYVASMFDKGQEANGMCACTLLESLSLASPFAVESCGQISVGVGIGWYLHPGNLTWIPKSRCISIQIYGYFGYLCWISGGQKVQFFDHRNPVVFQQGTLGFPGSVPLKGLHRSLPCRARKRWVTGVLGGVWGSGWCCLEPFGDGERWEKEVATKMATRALRESERVVWLCSVRNWKGFTYIYMDIFCILYFVDKLRL